MLADGVKRNVGTLSMTWSMILIAALLIFTLHFPDAFVSCEMIAATTSYAAETLINYCFKIEVIHWETRAIDASCGLSSVTAKGSA
jgi:hypothetical protein